MEGEILPAVPRRTGEGFDTHARAHDAARTGSGPSAAGSAAAPEVGRFRATDALTGAALARYLLGRVLVERISLSLYAVGVTVLVLAGVCWAFGPHWLAVLIGLVAVAVLAVRTLVIGLLHRLLAFGRFGPAEDRIRSLTADSRGDLRRELKRIGLPSSVLSMPLLVVRLLGKRRRETVERISRFDVERVVPPHRLDELALVVGNTVSDRTGARPSRPVA